MQLLGFTTRIGRMLVAHKTCVLSMPPSCEKSMGCFMSGPEMIYVKGSGVNYQLPHPNRNKRMTPKHKHFWCLCAMYLVGNGEKCSVCGHRNGPVRMKKTPPTIEEFFE